MQRPTGVTILAVLAFIFAGLFVVGALGVFIGGAALMRFIQSASGMGPAVAGLSMIIGVGILIGAVIYALVGYGLWNLQNWGRILCLILVALGLLSAALGLPRSFSPLSTYLVVRQLCVIAIDVWIIIYLLKPHVKQAFGA